MWSRGFSVGRAGKGNKDSRPCYAFSLMHTWPEEESWAWMTSLTQTHLKKYRPMNCKHKTNSVCLHLNFLTDASYCVYIIICANILA